MKKVVNERKFKRREKRESSSPTSGKKKRKKGKGVVADLKESGEIESRDKIIAPFVWMPKASLLVVDF